MAQPARNFKVGETVHMLSRVSLPGTKTPVSPASVALTSLTREDGEAVSVTLPMEFTEEREGELTLVLPTVDLVPATYLLTITHQSGPGRVALVTDAFVLQSP